MSKQPTKKAIQPPQPQLRVAGVQSQKPATHGPQTIAKPQPSFDQWFNRQVAAGKAQPKLKTFVKLHFQARGFMKSGQYDAGLKDFGL